MSAFLGPIHFWLYNKIEVQENILEAIFKVADKQSLKDEVEEKFGAPVVGELEDNIDTGNIHGWLQGRIASVESRMAFTVTSLLNDNAISKDELKEVFVKNAVECASKVENKDVNASELFKITFDFLLAGMPCDRVNEVISSDENSVEWQTTMDIHKQYWDNVNGDVNNYHYFIDAWIEKFISSVNSNFVYKKKDDLNIIERR